MISEFRRQGKPLLGARAVAEQALKAAVDCLAVGTGLGYRILRHRALPITEGERQEWEQVWGLVN